MTRHIKRKGAQFLTVMLTFAVLTIGCTMSQEKGWQAFHEWEGSEETGLDPLIVAGDGIVPFVLEKIQNKNEKGRGAAIRFLWNGNYVQAIPTLEQILMDSEDEERDSALLAIYGLDQKLGIKYVRRFRDEQSRLGELARRLDETREGWGPEKRTYWEALSSYYTDWLHN